MTPDSQSRPRGAESFAPAAPAYPARELEQRWQDYWRERGTFRTAAEPKRKYYVLEMFIYPSGDMHMGHARNYTIGDVIGRYRKMQGYDVLHPFGWDAFGLPAENAAIEHGSHPAKWTFESIDLCKRNLNLMGIGYDWDREINTCLPEYYRWDQWLFLRFYKRGLAYRKEALLNWCPKCRTVLANEQVIDGHCYRGTCSAAIEKRKMTQWFFRITAYAEELLRDIDSLDGWPESVRTMQRNWLGRSEGIELDFTLDRDGRKLPIFTTRPDTLWGVTFMALAPDAPLAEELLRGGEREEEGREFIRRVLLKPEVERVAEGRDKEGFFTGRHAVNPVNGEKVPVYIADFVLASYGTGMIMAVPGHDQRDFEFARKYGIPVKVVIQPAGQTLRPEALEAAWTEDGVMTDSGPFDGTVAGKGPEGRAGIERVRGWVEEQGFGRRTVNYRLKDWLISRQRYWGAPIPMIHCPACGVVPVPEEQLPVVLPSNVRDFKPAGTSVLASVKEFHETTCPACGGPAHRDPDTMDTFVNSSWYMARYTDPKNDRLPFGREAADAWLPIDEYIGGIEHATGHLIFFRFFTKVMADLGLLSHREPCRVLHTQGMVSLNGRTMSSSKNVGVWVGPFTAEYGADAARLAVLFAAPPDKGMDWTDELVTGVVRFLNRVWRLYEDRGPAAGGPPDPDRFTPAERELYIRLNQAHRKVIADTEAFQFNTAIAAQMELLNHLYTFADRESPVYHWCLDRLVYFLAPFAPHLAEELHHRLRPEAGSLFDERFPEPDARFLEFDTVTIPVQVNGKLRGRIEAPRGSDGQALRQLALADEAVRAAVGAAGVRKVIVVKDRMVNVVTGKESS
ncbi:MAG TPA: leucine--tRNA ligase [candidate division WOR-3 bacterium]|uniref:Leucine--tRNA ligase n=1 Tax=candidate division WOR-3 bacterium TaxID=2052148 RepID=A0A7V0XEN0_UNCW3|nr:leucine--tRNA ligase [candidate division WOR-3 bacterium]